MWMREMFAGSYRPEFVNISTPQGEIEALTFVIERSHDRYLPDLAMAEAAAIIARASGHNGTNFEYLDSLCAHLAELGLKDPEMAELHRLAADMRGQSASPA